MAKVMEIDGKPIINAKHRIVLRILAEDISAAKAKSPDACAAAVACIRQLYAMSARVHLSRTFVEYADTWYRYVTPRSLRTEVAAFDKGGKFEAGNHILMPPPVSQTAPAKLAQYHARKAKKKARASTPAAKRKLPPHQIVGVRHIAKY